MVHTALIAIAHGSEEIEFASTFDVLVRAGFKVTVGAVGQHRTVELSRKMKVESDQLLEHFRDSLYDVVVLPGGSPGAENLSKSADLDHILKNHKNNAKYIAAICASPAVVLKPKGYIGNGIKGTCYPSKSFLNAMGNDFVDVPVHTSGQIITATGPGTAIDFGLEITEKIINKQKADEVAQQLVYTRFNRIYG